MVFPSPWLRMHMHMYTYTTQMNKCRTTGAIWLVRPCMINSWTRKAKSERRRPKRERNCASGNRFHGKLNDAMYNPYAAIERSWVRLTVHSKTLQGMCSIVPLTLKSMNQKNN